MSKVLQDRNLNFKELTVTFTARTTQMNLLFFLLVCFLLYCSSLCFVFLTSQGTFMLLIFFFFQAVCVSAWKISQTSFTIQQFMETAALWDLNYRYVHYTFQIKELIDSHNLICQFKHGKSTTYVKKSILTAFTWLIKKSKG